MMTGPLKTSCAALALLALFLPGLISAQPADAQAQFNNAVERAKAGKHEEAVKICLDVLGKLPESERSRVHKLLGFSYKGLQKLPEAWHHLSLYVGTTGREDSATERWLEKVETELKESHVKVVLSCEPEGASLALRPDSSQDQPEYACPLTWWLKPGKHSIRAAKSGYEMGTVVVEVRQRGDKGVHSIALKALGPADGGKKPEPAITEPKESKGSNAVGITLIASGAALGIVGAVVHGVAYSKNEELHDRHLPSNRQQYEADYADQVKPKTTAAYVLYGTGGAALAAGIVMLVLRSPGEGEETSSFMLSPLSAPEGAGAMFTLQW